MLNRILFNRAMLLIIISIFFGVNTKSFARSEETLSFVLDNDVLVPGTRDQDYTGGLNISYSSETADNSFLYFKAPLNFADKIVGLKNEKKNIYSVEAGLYGFTPENTQQAQANQEDRPYASILYLSNAHERLSSDQLSATQTTLTVGILGLSWFGHLQNNIHRTTGSEKAMGWDNQISNGGELTARYQFSHQSAIDLGRFKINSPKIEAKFSQQLSIGFITEAALSISTRVGRLNSSWWSFNPELSNYGEQGAGEVGHKGESYFFAGASIKARVYNAFLQGQFRHSDVKLENNELNHLLAEVWLGYTKAFGEGFQLSYLVRAHTSEVKKGTADRALVWGGLVISKVW